MNDDGQFEFDDLPPPAARDSDPLTSHKAANRARLRQGTHCAQLLDIVFEHNLGITSDQAQKLVPGHDGRHHKRMPDLVRRGLVEDSGLVEPTRTGCDATIWQITEKGYQEALRLRGLKNGNNGSDHD